MMHASPNVIEALDMALSTACSHCCLMNIVTWCNFYISLDSQVISISWIDTLSKEWSIFITEPSIRRAIGIKKLSPTSLCYNDAWTTTSLFSSSPHIGIMPSSIIVLMPMLVNSRIACLDIRYDYVMKRPKCFQSSGSALVMTMNWMQIGSFMHFRSW